MRNVIPREEAGAASVFSFADFERKARDMLRQAEVQAQRILTDAEAQARAIAVEARAQADARRKQGYEAGLEQGRRDGHAQAYQDARQEAIESARGDLSHAAQALATSLREMEQEKRGLLALAESGLIELAVAIARRVTKIHVEASPEVARANARALLEMVAHHDDVELRLSPEDHQLDHPSSLVA